MKSILKSVAVLCCMATLAVLAACTKGSNSTGEKPVYKYLHYADARFTVPDRAFPGDSELEAFVEFVKTLPANAWLHFHCQAGAGRTTQYMIFYDMMRNPGLPLKDIAYRQCLLGGNYLLYDGSTPGEDPVKAELCAEKAQMIALFYDYIQDNHAKGYQTKWGQWKRQFSDK